MGLNGSGSVNPDDILNMFFGGGPGSGGMFRLGSMMGSFPFNMNDELHQLNNLILHLEMLEYLHLQTTPNQMNEIRLVLLDQ